MNTSKTISEYLNELSSSAPTPGGGNVAALCGALASSLGIMVCNLTIGKKNYEDVQNEISLVKEKLENYQKKFLELAEKDNQAFNKVIEAKKLPKETEEQNEIRSQKIQEATIQATEVPCDVIRNCNSILPLLKIIIDKGNKNSISDAGVAISLIKASSQSAYLNVLINCKSLSNQTIASELLKTTQIIFEEVEKNTDLYLNLIYDMLKL